MRLLRTLREHWLAWRYGRRGLPRTVNGVRMRALPQYRWYFPAEYDGPVAAALRSHIRPGAVCVSVGANMGIYPLLFAGWSEPGGTVHAFEPNPATADILAEHLRLNGVADRVRVARQAVGATPGEAAFFAAGVDGMSSLGAPNPLLKDGAREIRVPVTTLDAYCHEHAVRPDVLMIDVEGFEEGVLRGASELLARDPLPAVVVEMHPNAWASAGTDRTTFERLLVEFRLRPDPLSGQTDPMGDYGHVLLTRAGGGHG
jgi:FkbM family methyltransferase